MRHSDEIAAALSTVRSASNLSAEEVKALERAVWARSGLDLPTTPTVCEAHSEPWSMPQTQPWLTQHEIAEVLRLPPGTVRQWHNRRKLPKPSHRIAGRPVWSRKRIEAWCGGLLELQRTSRAGESLAQ